MKPIRCIIIDDNQPSIDLLTSYISNLNYLHLVKGFTNPIVALNEIDGLDVDLIFLDMQMPEMTGIEFLKSKRPKQFIVVISDYKEYAVDTYEINTYNNVQIIDYLSKIIKFDRFIAACEKVKSQFEEKADNNASNFIFLKDGTEKHKVFVNDIIYIDSDKQYKNVIIIHDGSDKKIKCRDAKHGKEYFIQIRNSLEEILTELPQNQFVQISKSNIVSLHHLKKIISPDEIEVSIGKRLTISNNDNFKETFNNKISAYKILGGSKKQS
jgi:two-component system, LytTR family, response regulator